MGTWSGLPAQVQLGAQLKSYRQAAGVELAEAAASVGVTPEEFSDWEEGKGCTYDPIHLFELGKLYSLNLEQAQPLFAGFEECVRQSPIGSVTGDLRPYENRHYDVMESALTSPAGPSGIFISYRRSDEPWYARTLYTKLADKFEKERVFIDIDNIGLGVDFVDAIDEALSKCVVLIVVVGKDWLNAAESSGTRRLDDPNDLVRLEIERGLARNILVIPILVDGASMPRAADLPESLRPLARRNGQEMSFARFGQDCHELISTLERILNA